MKWVCSPRQRHRHTGGGACAENSFLGAASLSGTLLETEQDAEILIAKQIRNFALAEGSEPWRMRIKLLAASQAAKQTRSK